MSFLVLVALGGAVGLILGALGGGGAILTVPLLVFVVGQPVPAATTSSLVIVGAAAVTGAVAHVRAGNVVWRSGLAFAAAGIPAAWVGTHFGQVVSERVMMVGFSALLIAAGIGMLRRVASETSTGAAAGPVSAARSPATMNSAKAGSLWVPIVGAGLAVGFLTGFFGVGGGFVIVPALVLLLGWPMVLATGTSLVIIAVNSLVSLVARGTSAQFEWAVIVPFTLSAMAFSLAGRGLAARVPADRLQRGFALLLLLVASYTLWRGASAP